MNTLHARLSLTLLLIVVLTGGAFFIVDRLNTRAYYEEVAQNLNAPIAMYIAAQRQLIQDGAANLPVLHELASHAMVINPAAEIYVLDREGRILGHDLEDIRQQRVDLGPVRALLSGNARLPLRGDDPRDSGARKIFSAAEVRSPQGLEGYVYVVLGGRTFDKLASAIADSYVGRSSAIAFVAIVALAALVGLLTFGLLTRRLKQLRKEMHAVIASGFEHEPVLTHGVRSSDEIDDLSNAFVDMSARIRVQIEQLKENDRLRRELVSNVSHDLRTPLAAMQGYIETLILCNDTLNRKQTLSYLQIVRKHTLRLGRLIGDLFELSKLDSASVSPALESFALPELVQDVAQEFRIEAERKYIDLSLDIDAAVRHTVGDIGLIQRVLENLVRNAVKFTPAGGAVVISIAARPDSVAVAVADNGSGIAADDVPKIFDRFYRARDGEEARSDSSGIGLAIVKRILDLHGSRITVASRPNAGTRFEFELPLAARAA